MPVAMPVPIAYTPAGELVTDPDALPVIDFPSMVRVAKDEFHVDGWRIPISSAPDAVVWKMLNWIKSWHKQSGDHDWAGSLTSLLFEEKRKAN